MYRGYLSALNLNVVLDILLAICKTYLVESRQTQDRVHQLRLTHSYNYIVAIVHIGEVSLSLCVRHLLKQLALGRVKHSHDSGVVGRAERGSYATLAHYVECCLGTTVVAHGNDALYRAERIGL